MCGRCTLTLRMKAKYYQGKDYPKGHWHRGEGTDVKSWKSSGLTEPEGGRMPQPSAAVWRCPINGSVAPRLPHGVRLEGCPISQCGSDDAPQGVAPGMLRHEKGWLTHMPQARVALT